MRLKRLSAGGILLLGAVAVASGSSAVASGSSVRELDIVGTNRVTINAIVSSTFHFQAGTIAVKRGDTITLHEQTGDAHTFTLVDKTLLPTTAEEVFGCGGPGTVCGAVFFAHFQPCFTSPPPNPSSALGMACASALSFMGSPPTSCTVTDPVLGTVPFCFQVVGAGGGSNPSSLSGLSLNTPWTAATATSPPPPTCIFGFCRGDSVIVFPGETNISFVVNLSPGTHHFMCVVHPWMQGDLIVS